MNNRKYNVIEVASPFLKNVISMVDKELCMQNELIENLTHELDELKKKETFDLNSKIDSQCKSMAQTLLASLEVPVDINSIGPVGAVILARIRDMQTIEQVNEYLDKILKQDKKPVNLVRNFKKNGNMVQ